MTKVIALINFSVPYMQGFIAGQEYELDEQSAGTLIRAGFVSPVVPAPEPQPLTTRAKRARANSTSK